MLDYLPQHKCFSSPKSQFAVNLQQQVLRGLQRFVLGVFCPLPALFLCSLHQTQHLVWWPKRCILVSPLFKIYLSFVSDSPTRLLANTRSNVMMSVFWVFFFCKRWLSLPVCCKNCNWWITQATVVEHTVFPSLSHKIPWASWWPSAQRRSVFENGLVLAETQLRCTDLVPYDRLHCTTRDNLVLDRKMAVGISSRCECL